MNQNHNHISYLRQTWKGILFWLLIFFPLFLLLLLSSSTAPITTQLLDGPFNSLGTIIITTDVGARFQICSPQFTLANGMVLCSQMGYRGAAQVFQGNYFGTAAGRTIAMDFNCVGNEKTIAACPGFEVIPGRTCPVKEATSLVCLESELWKGS